MVRALSVGVGVLACVGLGLGVTSAFVAAGVEGSLATSPSGGATAATTGSVTGAGGTPGVPAVPASWETIDVGAAATCPGLSWAVLAGIGRVESDSGQSTLPGVHSGANADGAEGPMQFEPATFAAYALIGPGGSVPATPYDPVDAVYTAAHMLCANGAGNPKSLSAAVFDYDHSSVYVDTVLVLADALETDPALGSVPATALASAAGQLGVPYQWGGEQAGVGFDCSGLVQFAYRAAGVTLPRVAQTQFDAGPRLARDTTWEPGDLVFFGASARDVTHVGIYLGSGEMIDAPHTGAAVQIESTPTTLGATWGGDVVVGATQPS